jgi:hypothetical protein
MRIAALASKKDKSDMEKGQLVAMQVTSLGARYADAQKRGDKTQIAALLEEAKGSPELMEAMAGTGMSEGVLESFRNKAGAIFGEQARTDRDKLAEKWASQGVAGLDDLEKRGMTEKVTISSKDAAGKVVQTKGIGWSTQVLQDLKGVKGGGQAADLALDLLQRNKALGQITGDKEKADALISIQQDSGKLTDMLAGMSLGDKRKFAKTMAGTAVGDMALDTIADEQRFTGAMKGKKGNIGAAAAATLGIRLDKEKEDTLAGKSPAEIAAILSKQVGGGKDVNFNADLTKALEAAKAGKPEAGTLLQKALGGASQEVKTNIQKANKEAEDPLSAEIAKNTGASAKFLEAQARGAEAVKALLASIDSKTTAGGKDNPEAP